jgi:hypothetical protein
VWFNSKDGWAHLSEVIFGTDRFEEEVGNKRMDDTMLSSPLLNKNLFVWAIALCGMYESSFFP